MGETVGGEPMVLVVGGAGYIGAQTERELARRGYRTVVYDDLGRGHREAVKWGELVEGNLADRPRLEEVFASRRVGAVLHLDLRLGLRTSQVVPGRTGW